MKNRFPSIRLLTLALTIPFLFSCDDDNKASLVLTENEAVEIVENSLKTDSEGIESQSADIARMADETANEMNCNSSFDSTITRGASTNRISYSYTFNWNWDLSCNQLSIPQQIDFDYSMAGSFETNRIISSDNATADLIATGLEFSSSEITLNGTYTRNGSTTSKVRNQNDITTKLSTTITGVEVGKSSQEITGGSGSITLEATGSGGQSVIYTGTITFLGNQTATLVINGNTYNLDWSE